ncbi:MAG: M48 family metalloprotease [Gemmatimonadota bacterium]|nr:M48 family metalloprotease [Gemmatimonadota bacterium]
MIGRGVRALVTALLVLLLAAPAARAQIFGEIQEKVQDAAEKVQQARKYGAAVVPISTGQEIEIGRGIAATLAGAYGVDRDPELTRYVNLVGSVVASVDPRPGIAYRFAVLDTDAVNAFAAPGGYVFVTRGALAAMEDEATLAAVLAHEVGHVDARDVVEEIQSRARTALGIEEAAEAVDVTGEEYLTKAVETGATALFMGLSREDELEADRFAVERLAAVGYDPDGLLRFLEALEERSGDEDVSLLEKTHPDASDRIDEAEEVVEDLPDERREGVVAEARFRRALEEDTATPGF